MKNVQELDENELEKPTTEVLVVDSDEDMDRFMKSMPERARRMAERQKKEQS
jgi:hypothetical protein